MFDATTEMDEFAIHMILNTLEMDKMRVRKQLRYGFWIRAIGAFMLGGKKGYGRFKQQYQNWQKLNKMTATEATKPFYQEIHSLRPILGEKKDEKATNNRKR